MLSSSQPCRFSDSKDGRTGACSVGSKFTKGIFVDNPYGHNRRATEFTSQAGGKPGRNGAKVPDSLTRAFVNDILSMMSDRYTAGKRRQEGIDPEAIDALCDRLVNPNVPCSAALLDQARSHGGDIERIYEGVVARSARQLGVRWEDDRSTFLDVTVGLSRLHAMVRDLGEGIVSAVSSVNAPCALLAPCPGEDHTLGITMVADYFRRAGWQVNLAPKPDLKTLLEGAKSSKPQYIGLSIGTLRLISRLRETIRELRAVCPDATIAVGGSATVEIPNLGARVGADTVTVDAINAAQGARTAVTGYAYARA